MEQNEAQIGKYGKRHSLDTCYTNSAEISYNAACKQQNIGT